MRNRKTDICFPVFGYRVRVIFARDIARTGRSLGSNLTNTKAAFLSVESADSGKPNGWIVLPADPPPEHIAHEAAHAVRAIFEHASTKQDDEAFAYHLDYLVGRIHKFLRRK